MLLWKKVNEKKSLNENELLDKEVYLKYQFLKEIYNKYRKSKRKIRCDSNGI